MRAILQNSTKLTGRLQWGFRHALMVSTFLSIICLSPTSAAPSADPEFSAFWNKFKAAIVKNDKNAIANLTRFPYPTANKNVNRDEFIKTVPTIFDPATRKSLLGQKPFKEKGSYMVSSGEQIFVFSKVSGKGYLFTEITPDD